MRRNLERCWEFMRCGDQLTCPAYPDCGEKCWEAAGTMRNNEAEKRLEKQSKLARESGRDLTEQQLIQLRPSKAVKLCKYIERYTSCRCCPYYQYVEKSKKSMGGKKMYGDAF